MDKFLADKKAICVFVLPAFLIFAVIVIAPIFFSSYYSTLRWDGFGNGAFIGLQNFVGLFTNTADGFPKSIINSFILAGLSVFVQLPLALFFALVLARGIKGEVFYRTVYFIPVILSTVVIGQLWMKIYHPSFGLLNIFLSTVGLKSLTHAWLGSTDTALFAAFIPSVWQYIGYHMLLMYASAKSVSDDIYEAAKIDGASEAAIARYITIPLIMPMIKICVIFAVIGSLKSFDLVYILTGGGPVHASEVPSTLMFNTIFFKYMYGYGSAMAVFIIAECLLFTVAIQKLLKAEDSL
ncbi:raffinose/stachyose/melibiose transport system permease protein [Hydrogenispora ethanolica]|uniref:Raffinose/stachyose/melibiose transport system permease protein n=1 Tax=Hydrogenispora ethanolica TaxID=1082276 RepID=A0A4R1RZ94_HYDET|nr:sugar ABC transporter permease [Hydrogenispora ethanolica]TCL71570.1 raffinose/stachyose/melibiose transport system permease protein [Hydrogenispora ethanolica]